MVDGRQPGAAGPNDREPDGVAGPIPPASGRAHELSRRRRAPRRGVDTGRQHHLGAAPAVMPVLDADGPATTTRTAAVQLAARTVPELRRLEAQVEAEMRAAADAGDYERAAGLRDEAAAVRRERDRR